MKYSSIFPVLIAAMTAGACSVDRLEENQESHPGEGKIVFTAEYAGVGTKTSMHDETTIWWSPGDEICVFYGESGKNRFISEETEPSQKAHFTGNIGAFTGITESGDFNYFWALYPYDAAISCDGTSVVAELSDRQTAKAGSFADNTNITLAKSSGLALSFFNVCSGFRFSVTREGIRSVTFRGNDNEDIAGTFRVSMDTKGKPTSPKIIDGSKEVTLTAPDGGTFEVGPLYYIEILPQVLTKGFTLTFYTNDSYGSRRIDRSASFERSSFNRGLNFDASVTYSAYPTNEIRYTSSDGNVVVPNNPDAFGATIISNTCENGHGVILFDGDVTVFGEQAFESCDNLKSLDIPQTVTDIKCSLNHLPNLESFSGKFASADGRFLIDNGRLLAVAGKDLTELIVPDCVSIIGKASLQNLKDVKTINIPEGVALEEGNKGNIFLRDENLERIIGPLASEDGRYLIFNDCIMGFAPADLHDIDIPQGVKTIPDEAFRYGRIFPTSGEHFGTVTIPESVTEIGRCAFWDFKADRFVFNSTVPAAAGYSWLSEDTEIFVPVGFVETYRNAEGWGDLHDMITSEGCRIYYTSTDGELVEPWDVKSYYGTDPFNVNVISNTYENNLGTIVCDGEINTIHGDTFFQCRNLKTIRLPETVSTLDGSVFRACSSLEAIYGHFSTEDNRCVIIEGKLVDFAYAGVSIYAIPEEVTALGRHCLAYTELKQIYLPETITKIGAYAISPSIMESIVIPDSVTIVEGGAFADSPNLKAFYGKNASDDGRLLIIDGSLCGFAPAGLTEYTMPEGITRIESEVFRGCGHLEKITIPSTVSTIDSYLFNNCYNLKKVIVLATVPPEGAWELLYGADQAQIFVPAASVNAYKAAENWSKYADRIFPIEDDGSTEPVSPGTDY